MARTLITAVLLGYLVNTLVSAWGAGSRGVELLSFIACLAVILLLQLAHSMADVFTWPASKRTASLVVQAVATLLPLLWVGPLAGSTAGFLAGSVLLTVKGAIRWALFVVVGVGLLAALAGAHLQPSDLLYAVYFTWLTGLMVYGISSLESLARTILSARGDLVRMAIISERLRLARDLHDLLGFNVSAIILKSELAYRLLPAVSERARQEVEDVRGIARRALLDVRAVTDGYGPMSLVAEVESTRAMLLVAEIDVQVEMSPEPLRESLDTVLTIVLREAATNILRHSKAESVKIELTERDGVARLRIANDGVDAVPRPGSLSDGSGLQNLTSRLEGMAGRLSVTKDDEWFSVIAEVPLTARGGELTTRKSDPADLPDDDRPGTDLPVRTRPWHLRMARLIAVVVLIGYGLLLLVNGLDLNPGVLGFAGLSLCVAAQVGLQISFAIGEPRSWPRWARAAALAAQAAVTVAPLFWLGQPWGSMAGFLAGSMLLVLPRIWQWLGYAAVGLGVLGLAVADHEPGAWTAYLTISTLLTGLVAYGVGSLAGLVARIELFRQELARMAVAKNRLAAASELNEFLSQDLSMITAKSERAYRLIPRAPEQAREEMAEVLDIARRSVVKVRSVASGYRHRSFAMELGLTTPALGAVGITVCAEVSPEAIPAGLDAVLALVLREATTNLLQSRRAKQCTIELVLDDEQVSLRIADDRSGSGGSALIRKNSALEELARRVQAIGGRLAVTALPGRFQIVVEIPRNRRLPADSATSELP